MELQLISLKVYLHGGNFEKYTFYQTLFFKQNHKVKIKYDALAMHCTCKAPDQYNTYNIHSLHEKRQKLNLPAVNEPGLFLKV